MSGYTLLQNTVGIPIDKVTVISLIMETHVCSTYIEIVSF